MTGMKTFAAVAALAAVTMPAQPPAGQRPASPTVVLQNASVRAYRTTTDALAGVPHGPGAVVWLEVSPPDQEVRVLWMDDVAAPPLLAGISSPIVVVQPLERGAAGAATPIPSESRSGDAEFTGMSFVRVFENARVSIRRAHMDVDAREGLHTHGADIVVVHVSGGEIEDTSNGKTVVNRWRPGDVEFEARGSSHSARNVGQPINVVLVELKP
jgi:quercetin dioxygenase-like cupin family protein